MQIAQFVEQPVRPVAALVPLRAGPLDVPLRAESHAILDHPPGRRVRRGARVEGE